MELWDIYRILVFIINYYHMEFILRGVKMKAGGHVQVPDTTMEFADLASLMEWIEEQNSQGIHVRVSNWEDDEPAELYISYDPKYFR